MKIGQMVILIGCDGFMPPLGAYGETVGLMDEVGDYEVLFPRYPCPVGDEISWFIPARWLMPIDPPAEKVDTVSYSELSDPLRWAVSR